MESHKVVRALINDEIIHRPGNIEYKRRHPHKKLLLLDLDETLIHCSGDLSLREKFDQELMFINDEGIHIKGLLNVRPFARLFLANMNHFYEVVIFTASMKYYADRILKVLDPNREYISGVFYR